MLLSLQEVLELERLQRLALFEELRLAIPEVSASVRLWALVGRVGLPRQAVCRSPKTLA
jgi:hypothetical protein